MSLPAFTDITRMAEDLVAAESVLLLYDWCHMLVLVLTMFDFRRPVVVGGSISSNLL
jgi:hypothetical protein